MKKYRLKKDLPMLEAGNEVLLELKKINDKKIGLYYDIKIPNDNRVFDSFGIIGKSKINEWLEEVVEKPKSVWGLKEGDRYCYIDDIGFIAAVNISSEGDIFEYNQRISNGNVFLVNSEEAKKEARRREAIQKIKKYCWENNINTRYYKSNVFYFYLDDGGIVRYRRAYRIGSSIGYFSKENVEKILEKFKDELKVILDV